MDRFAADDVVWDPGDGTKAVEHRARHVVAVVVNWNRPEETRECIASLRASDYPELTVLLVDNGSTDGSISILRQNFPDLQILSLSQNRGFSGGTNAGIQRALSIGADAVLLVNNDTAVAPNAVSLLVASLDARFKIATPRINFWATARLWHAGARQRGLFPLPRELSGADLVDNRPIEIEFAVGCILLVERSVFEQIGGLDERYFMYYEDLDFSTRARAAGIRIVTVPAARAWHRVGTSLHHDSPRRAYLLTRYGTLWCKSQKRGFRALAWWLSNAYRASRQFVLSSLSGDLVTARAVLDGLRDGFAGPRSDQADSL